MATELEKNKWPPKKLIVHEIMKREGSFTQTEIVMATGLDQRTVSPHMLKLVQMGYLYKNPNNRKSKYEIVNRYELIEHFSDIKEKTYYPKPDYEYIVSPGLDRTIESIRAMRALGMTGWQEAQTKLYERLENMITELQMTKRYIPTEMNEKNAREFLNTHHDDGYVWANLYDYPSIKKHFSETAWNRYCIDQIGLVS